MRTGFDFDYGTAFTRNLGLVTPNEQERLRNTRVALAGLGGVGGAHLQALVRMGIGHFNLADPDTFDLVNFNRQMGATLANAGRRKCDVLEDMALAVNPEAGVRTFPEGVRPANLDAFLEGVDVVVDGIEFFQIEARRLLCRACRERGIPVVNAGPIGYGAAVLVFMPQGMSFDEYFRLEDGMSRAEQLLALALGLSPGMVSDLDPSRVDAMAQTGPVLVTACLLCAAAAATEVLKLVCERGCPVVAPRGVYLDPYRARTVRLRPRPSLRRSLRGRLLRASGFRRFPSLRALHERGV